MELERRIMRGGLREGWKAKGKADADDVLGQQREEEG